MTAAMRFSPKPTSPGPSENAPSPMPNRSLLSEPRRIVMAGGQSPPVANPIMRKLRYIPSTSKIAKQAWPTKKGGRGARGAGRGARGAGRGQDRGLPAHASASDRQSSVEEGGGKDRRNHRREQQRKGG